VTVIPPEMAGIRLDRALCVLFPAYSRARLQHWIRCGRATVDARSPRPRDLVRGGERVELYAEAEPDERWTPEPLPLPVIHQDDDIMVVDKPHGLVVHPGAGNRSGTLVNALLHRDAWLSAIPRAGVVHRLDKDTSGLLVVARSLRAHKSLVDQIRTRSMRREYEAVVSGVVTAGGRIEAPVGRHPTQRTRMAVVPSGRPATTHYRVLRRFRAHTHLRLRLESGRTHQIRVHMAHAGFPLLGDPVYGGRPRPPARCASRLMRALESFRRQALHAAALEFRHPEDGRVLAFEAPLPPDLEELLAALAEDADAA